MKKNEINTSLSDDLSEKKMISSTIKDLNKKIESLEKKFTKKEKDEQEQILGILEVDEETEIKKLENNTDAKLVRDSNNLIEFLKDHYKDRMTEFISIWGRGCLDSNVHLSQIKKGGRIHLKDYQIPVDAKGEGFNSIPFWNEIFNNIYKNINAKQIDQIQKLGSSSEKISMFEKMKSKYKDFVKKLEKERGGKVDNYRIQEEYFYFKNKKLIDDMFKLVINSIKNSFSSNKNSHAKDKKTVEKLKGDIKLEKDLVKQIHKKHKFVEKILACKV